MNNPTKIEPVDLDPTPIIRATKLKNPTGVELMGLIIRELKIACNWDANKVWPKDTPQIDRFPMSQTILELSQALRNVVEITAPNEQLWAKINKGVPNDSD